MNSYLESLTGPQIHELIRRWGRAMQRYAGWAGTNWAKGLPRRWDYAIDSLQRAIDAAEFELARRRFRG